MNIRQYQKLVKRTAKKFDNRINELSAWGLGLVGEAGDIAGCIKKTLFHENDQMLGVRENLGDVLWYIAMICNVMGWKLEDILNENISKLKERYPDGFTIKDAKRKGKRIDWMERKG